MIDRRMKYQTPVYPSLSVSVGTRLVVEHHKRWVQREREQAVRDDDRGHGYRGGEA